MSTTPPQLPKIRVVDAVATSAGDSLAAVDARLVEFQLGELERLVGVLGAEGLTAFCAYLRVLDKEDGPDGTPMLLVQDFSGRWLQEHTALTRNAAYRAQRALEDSGIFDRLVSRAGQGARGKQRARLNPTLVLVPGGADGDISSLRVAKRGPNSRKPGVRENGPDSPFSQKVGERENGADSRSAHNRENGPTDPAFAQVSATMPDLGTGFSTGPTSSSQSGVIHSLLSSGTSPGLLRLVLAPAVHRHRARVHERLFGIFNSDQVARRLEPLVEPLRLDGGSTRRCRQFVDYLCDVLADDLDPRTELANLNAHGRLDLPDPVLVERLTVGLVVGLGMPKQVRAWGAWMHTVTRPEWSPVAGNQLLVRLAAEVDRLAAEQPTVQPTVQPTAQAAGQVVPAPADLPRTPADPGATEEPAPEPDPAPSPAPSPAAAPEPALLAPELLAEHFPAARERFAFLFPAGSPRVEDPVWQSRVVQMLLDDLEDPSGAAETRAG